MCYSLLCHPSRLSLSRECLLWLAVEEERAFKRLSHQQLVSKLNVCVHCTPEWIYLRIYIYINGFYVLCSILRLLGRSPNVISRSIQHCYTIHMIPARLNTSMVMLRKPVLQRVRYFCFQCILYFKFTFVSTFSHTINLQLVKQ